RRHVVVGARRGRTPNTDEWRHGAHQPDGDSRCDSGPRHGLRDRRRPARRAHCLGHEEPRRVELGHCLAREDPEAYESAGRGGATGADCVDLDIGHGQSQYDLTVAVDPGNPNNVLIGGNLCGARSIDGGATWQIVSDWLAFGEASNVDGMGYVHADWHASLVT